ncbi:MAG: hypothetical protein JSR26_00495 [Proteobacteria bacterium]|nr:hypothetical protein [Pseudomonadota bacterium]
MPNLSGSNRDPRHASRPSSSCPTRSQADGSPGTPVEPPFHAIPATRRTRPGRRPATASARRRRARARPRPAHAVAVPAHRRPRPSRPGRSPGGSHDRTRTGHQRGQIGARTLALRARTVHRRGHRPAHARAQGARVRATALGRLRLLFAAAGRACAGLRRAVADRLGGLRSGHRPSAGPARARTHRRLHPRRHHPRRPARTRTPRSARPAHRLATRVSIDAPDPHDAYLVDASMYVFRAWHSIPPDLTDADGCPVNAVHGFTRFVLELLERRQPRRIVVAFDAALESSFRNTLYPPYKANRDPAPDELKRQFAHCVTLCEALGLTVLVDNRYEADDLIGSALHRLRAHGLRGVIVSADKDLSQLLQGDDEQWDYARDQRWNAAGVKARYGVHAHQIADFLGLCGDAVDNIPGVPGIGAKTAATLLGHFGSLDALLARHAEIPYLRLRGAAMHAQRLREHRDLALLCRQLATIALDAPLPADLHDGRRGAQDETMLTRLLDHLRVGPMTRRRIAAVAI